MQSWFIRNRDRVQAKLLTAQVSLGETGMLGRRLQEFEGEVEIFDSSYAPGRQTTAAGERLQDDRKIDVAGESSCIRSPGDQPVASCIDTGSTKNSFQHRLVERPANERDAHAAQAERFVGMSHRFEQRLMRRDDLIQRSVLRCERPCGSDYLTGVVNARDTDQIDEDVCPVVMRQPFANAEEEDAVKFLRGPRKTQALAGWTRRNIDDPTCRCLTAGGHAVDASLAAARRRATSCASRAWRS